MKLVKTHLSATPKPWSHPLVSLILLSFLLLSFLGWNETLPLDRFSASREQIFKSHEYWRLFTTIGIHADLRHFISNALFFWIFGVLLHSYFGFFVFPVLSLFFGALANAATLYFYPDHSVLIGASGVVYFMAGAWATLYFFIERGSHPLKRIVAALGVSLILFFPTTYEPETSYLAHLIGFAFGIIAGMSYFFFKREKIRENEVWKEEVEFHESPQLPPDLDRVPDAVENLSD